MMLMAFVKVALQDCESLVTRLRQKDAEIKWIENKHITTKALHVKVCECVCARVLTPRICACVRLRVWLACDSTRGSWEFHAPVQHYSNAHENT